MVFHEEWMKQSIISFKDAFGDHFVQGRVSNIDFETKIVFLEDTDQTIEYTDVVFAVGNDGTFPGTPQPNAMEVLLLFLVILVRLLFKPFVSKVWIWGTSTTNVLLN